MTRAKKLQMVTIRLQNHTTIRRICQALFSTLAARLLKNIFVSIYLYRFGYIAQISGGILWYLHKFQLFEHKNAHFTTKNGVFQTEQIFVFVLRPVWACCRMFIWLEKKPLKRACRASERHSTADNTFLRHLSTDGKHAFYIL